MPEPLPHEGDHNTHRFCMTQSDKNDQPWQLTLEINRSDAWGISRTFGRVFGFVLKQEDRNHD